MVVLPGGSFWMGDLQGGGYDDERPVHTVRIKSFAVSKHEVTRAQFAAFVKATGYDAGSGCWRWDQGEEKVVFDANADWRNPGFSQTGQHPVVCVSWDHVKAYVEWLRREMGKRYRLLTEAEWEYAARAGTETQYYSGNSEASLRGNANCFDDSLCPVGYKCGGFHCNDGYQYTSPVGRFRANGFGLHDMHGNVWEWVEDCWHEDYRGAPVDGSAWTRGCDDVKDIEGVRIRVLRGGSWGDGDAGDLRAAARNWSNRVDRVHNGGFRLAQDL